MENVPNPVPALTEDHRKSLQYLATLRERLVQEQAQIDTTEIEISNERHTLLVGLVLAVLGASPHPALPLVAIRHRVWLCLQGGLALGDDKEIHTLLRQMEVDGLVTRRVAPPESLDPTPWWAAT